MKTQTVMGSLVELPGWLQAAGWGLLSASGLLIGAIGGYYTWLQHRTISRVMTFAAGVLLSLWWRSTWLLKHVAPRACTGR